MFARFCDILKDDRGMATVNLAHNLGLKGGFYISRLVVLNGGPKRSDEKETSREREGMVSTFKRLLAVVVSLGITDFLCPSW